MVRVFATLSFLVAIASATPSFRSIDPLVTIRNGTIRGLHSNVWNQDFFLGVPYCQPATGSNRFALPKPITTKWKGELVAQTFGDRCLGLHHPFPDLPQSEDCLNINIIRPTGYSNTKLPILVWIHGGGFTSSGSSNPPYNMTWMVDQSVKIGKPIMGVSFNYRLTAWGMLSSTSMSAAGISNIGLHDQRTALHWVQENIEAFGGDPRKVTIGGDSAGGVSVGIHTQAYFGRDDKLFRAAIHDSGPGLFIGAYATMPTLDKLYNALLANVSCTMAADKLSCLRQVPSNVMWAAIQTVDSQYPTQWQYHVDGGIIPELSSVALQKGHFVKVPILVGSTTDEGTYAIGYGVNTTDELIAFLKVAAAVPIDQDTIDTILELYPDNPVIGIPGGTIERFPPPYGLQYKRLAAIAGDYYLIAGRRFTSRVWAQRGLTAYSWRFDTIPNGVPREMGSTHVTDQAFVFANFQGVGYGENYYDVSPLSRKENYIRVGLLMSRSLVSFVHDLTPNNHGVPGYPKWPKYDLHRPQNFVFLGNTTSFVEDDDFRVPQIDLWIDNSQEYGH
ncbi:hypothetical protein TWF694_000264 [Orbilia ellipsospora]|uniref:Carboxylic ester hydrolase n=1 Tax=Orbilia ellipsospora TaxID=2528407 RepID=A0AAV9XN45_9PEZI